MNEIIELDPRQQGLKTLGHISYLLHAVVAIGAVLPGVQGSVLLLLIAFALDMWKRDDAARQLAGVALQLAHPQRALGRRPLPDHRAALAAAPRSRLDRLGADLDLVPLPDRPRLAEPVVEHADADLRGVAMNRDPGCIFCKIAAGQIPSRKVYEDDDLLAFHDIAPWAPVHVLMIPSSTSRRFYDVGEEHAAMLGRMMVLAPRLMREFGVTDGFRTLINTGTDGLPGSTAPPCACHGRAPALGEGLT